MAACRMRMSKSVLKRKRQVDSQAQLCSTALADICSTRPSAANVVLRRTRGVVGLVFVNRRAGTDGCSRRGLAFEQMLQIAFSPIFRLGDIAKTWLLDSRWVARIREAVAFSFMFAVHVLMMKGLAVFRTYQPMVFVSSLAFDEST